MKRGLTTLAAVSLIVIVVAFVAIVMLITSQRTGGGVYGGALKYKDWPYWEGRKVAGAYGDSQEAYYTQVPQRHVERSNRQVPAGRRYSTYADYMEEHPEGRPEAIELMWEYTPMV